MSMAGRSIYDLASPDVADMIGRKGMVVMPFGSVEQHGPHLPCGTDTMAADLVAAELAERLDAIVVPAGPYGVTPIHAGHPGTISLRRDVFEAYLANLCEEMVAMGARTFVFVNWHEGNIASLDAVATDAPGSRGRPRRHRARLLHGAAHLLASGWGAHPRWRDRDPGGARSRPRSVPCRAGIGADPATRAPTSWTRCVAPGRCTATSQT